MTEKERLTAHVPIAEWDELERRLEIMARMTTDYPMNTENKSRQVTKSRRSSGKSWQFFRYLKNK